MQKGFVLVPILIIAFIIVIPVGAYYFYSDKISTKSIATPDVIRQDVVSTPSPQKLSLDKADWKEFSDPNFNLKFKYPSTAIAQVLAEEQRIVISENKIAPYFIFTINITNNPSDLTSYQVLEKKVEDLRNKNIPGSKNLADYRQSTIQDYESGYTKGSLMRWGKDGDSVSDALQVVFVAGDKIYDFMIHDGNGTVDEYQKKMMDEILSTFVLTIPQQFIIRSEQ